LARLRGSPEEAWEFVRSVGIAARQLQGEGVRLSAHLEYARVLLATGRLAEVLDTLTGITWADASENGHRRYAYRLIIGDHHLALAREAAGMPPTDDEMAVELPPLDHVTDPDTTRAHLADARAAYARADEVGRWIDGQLECTWRTAEITERLRRVSAIEDAARA
jgi:hypothetical protein